MDTPSLISCTEETRHHPSFIQLMAKQDSRAEYGGSLRILRSLWVDLKWPWVTLGQLQGTLD